MQDKSDDELSEREQDYEGMLQDSAVNANLHSDVELEAAFLLQMSSLQSGQLYCSRFRTYNEMRRSCQKQM